MKIAVIGGLGHIGLPLSLLLAENGHTVEIYDVNRLAMFAFEAGKAMFHEPNLNELIKRHNHRISVFYGDDRDIEADAVIVATNIENPLHLLTEYLHHQDPTPIFIRQTLPVGTMRQLEMRFSHVAYIPERIAQGNQLEEFETIPQIVGTRDLKMQCLARKIFNWLDVVITTPEEAEIAKLGCNFFRYATFAAANQLYMTCVNLGVDFNNVREAMMHEYPRMAHFPKAGWAGGFCLPKDAKLLGKVAPHANDVYALNNASFPQFLFAQLRDYLRQGYSVSVLGLTAMADCDDMRGSLLSILREELRATPEVLLYDPFCEEKVGFSPLHLALASDVICIGVPHRMFQTLDFSGKILLDPWNVAKHHVEIEKAG